MPLLHNCEPTVLVTSLTPLCWRWLRWPWVKSVWQHNKGRPESLFCQGSGCSLYTSYIRNVKAMLLLCVTSQENTPYAILFDELGFWVLGLWKETWLLLFLRLFEFGLSAGYLTAFQSVIFVWHGAWIAVLLEWVSPLRYIEIFVS